MRFESVIAHAFGPFSGRTLELAPGLNVVHGPNEAGKSTWHAALYAGLCGIRRARGATRAEDRRFVERHRPWDGGGWEVSAVVGLEDGRRIELRHDLEGRVACQAVDATLGRDCSAEIMHDGAPDGSRWLGLDRRSFLATACVRQADLLAVLEQADLLQEHLQRAASTAGANATAAEALERIERFHLENVGPDQVNSKRPLRRALARLEAARQGLEQAKAEHGDYLDLAAAVEVRQAEAALAQQQLRLVQARRAAVEAEDWERRFARVRELAGRYPDGPPPGALAEDELAQEVASVLRAWEERPEVPILAGPSAQELRRALETLPEGLEGDREPHATVVDAHLAFLEARGALEQHDRDRPPDPAGLDLSGTSEQELRSLAWELSLPEPRIDPALLERFERAQRRAEELARKRNSRTAVIAAATLATLGVVALFAGLIIPAVVLLGGAGLAWLLTGSVEAERVKALEELRASEHALGGQQHAVEEVNRRRQAARERAATLGLPAEPGALQQVIQTLADSTQASRDLAQWTQKQQRLADQLEASRAGLAGALRARGVEVEDNVDLALAWYKAACRERNDAAARASRRSAVEGQLAAREQVEQAARRTAERRRQAEAALRDVAAQCGVRGEADGALATGLREWQRRRAGNLHEHERARSEWVELESLLGGKTPAELSLESRRRRESADRLAAGLDPEARRAVELEDDVEAHLERLDRAAREKAAILAQTRGQLEERARSLHSVAEAEEERAGAEAELARLRQLDRTLLLTSQFLRAAQDRAHRDVAPVLAASVRRWLPEVTSGRYHDVRVDPQALRVQVCGEGDRWREAALLSHGTAEQVYLLLRVAMAEHLTARGEVCPLVLDDVTAHCDSQRQEAILRALHVISQGRQVILFSQEDEVLAWAEATLQPPRDRLARLDRALVPA